MSRATNGTPRSVGSPGLRCRFCNSRLQTTFVDLGMSPLCESFLRADQLDRMEPFYPLHVYVCENCLLVQLGEYVPPKEIFEEYAYFSSFSDSWVRHAEEYTEKIIGRFGIDARWKVVELASNDGYLLQHFVRKNIPCMGIEPAKNVARVAIERGITTIPRFFGAALARELSETHGLADLLIGNNVLAHVPDLNDFVEGMKILLSPDGLITMEFPHLLRLMKGNEFDTIYHEHFSYFSFLTVNNIFEKHGLRLFDIEELPSHGGSLRIYAQHAEGGTREISEKVFGLRSEESASGLDRLETYGSFKESVYETKRRFLGFLIEAKRNGKSIVNYGAPGKGNTLLNYCGVRLDFIDYAVDRNPYKQGRYTPGTHIPIFPPEKILETKPDFIVIIPWNLRKEISRQLSFTAEWGAQLVVPIPQLEVFAPGTEGAME